MIVLWLILYGAVFRPESPVIRVFCSCIYAAALMYYLKRRGKAGDYSFSFPGMAALVRRIPLLALCVCNVVSMVRGGSRIPGVEDIILAVFVSFAEEMFFRGYLTGHFRFKYGIVAVNVLFALSHLLTVDSYTLECVFQCLCAFCMGMCFNLITQKDTSLFCPAVLHALINITALPVMGQSIFMAAICAVISGACLIYTQLFVANNLKFGRNTA